MAHSTPSALYFPTESSGIGSISITVRPYAIVALTGKQYRQPKGVSLLVWEGGGGGQCHQNSPSICRASLKCSDLIQNVHFTELNTEVSDSQSGHWQVRDYCKKVFYKKCPTAQVVAKNR